MEYAFPHKRQSNAYPDQSILESGMTLRDYFACGIASALTSNLHNYNKDITNQDIAIRAYSVADEMLKERAK